MWLVKQMEHWENIRGRAPQRKSYNGKLPMCASDRRFAFSTFFLSSGLWTTVAWKVKILNLLSVTLLLPLCSLWLFELWMVTEVFCLRPAGYEGVAFWRPMVSRKHSWPIDVTSLTETWFWMSVSVEAVELCLEFHLDCGFWYIYKTFKCSDLCA